MTVSGSTEDRSHERTIKRLPFPTVNRKIYCQRFGNGQGRNGVFYPFFEILTLDLLCLCGDQNVKTDIIGIKDTRNR